MCFPLRRQFETADFFAAISKSYFACDLSQRSGVPPKTAAIRKAISGLTSAFWLIILDKACLDTFSIDATSVTVNPLNQSIQSSAFRPDE